MTVDDNAIDPKAVAGMSAGVGPAEIAWCTCELAGVGRVAVLEPDDSGGLSVVNAWPDGDAPPQLAGEMVLAVHRDGALRETSEPEDLAAASALSLDDPPTGLIAMRIGTAVVVGLRVAEGPVLEPERRAFAAGARMLATAQRAERDPDGHLAASAGRVADLVDAGLALSSETSIEALLERVTMVAREVLGARYAALGVLDERGTGLRSFVTSGLDAPTAARIGARPRGLGLLGAVIEEGRTIRLDDIGADPRAVGFPAGHPRMTSFLGVPITLGGEVYGNLYVTDKLSGAFSREDERLARTLAAQAAVAIENARRHDRERRRAEEMETALEIGQALLSVLDLDELLPLIARRARRLVEADTVAVGVRDGDEVEFRYAHGAAALELEGRRGPADAVALGAPLAGLADGTWEIVPLEIDGTLAGVLVAVRGYPFDAAAKRLLRLLSVQGAIALANARAHSGERDRLLASAALEATRAKELAAAEGFRRAVEAQEAERARIARELHDEAGQVLTGLSLHLRAIEDRERDPDVRSSLAELRASVGAVSSGLRELITELRPSGLREHGLEGAIEGQAERLRGATGISVDLAVSRLPALTQEVEVVVFRVVQEALTNVARHSGASHASVVASARAGRLRIVVEDDGRGFDPSLPTGRLGLAGIRERVEMLGGALKIDSSPGAGTALTVDLDMSKGVG